jgi:hypothetical protein
MADSNGHAVEGEGELVLGIAPAEGTLEHNHSDALARETAAQKSLSSG